MNLFYIESTIVTFVIYYYSINKICKNMRELIYGFIVPYNFFLEILCFNINILISFNYIKKYYKYCNSDFMLILDTSPVTSSIFYRKNIGAFLSKINCEEKDIVLSCEETKQNKLKFVYKIFIFVDFLLKINNLNYMFVNNLTITYFDWIFIFYYMNIIFLNYLGDMNRNVVKIYTKSKVDQKSNKANIINYDINQNIYFFAKVEFLVKLTGFLFLFIFFLIIVSYTFDKLNQYIKIIQFMIFFLFFINFYISSYNNFSIIINTNKKYLCLVFIVVYIMLIIVFYLCAQFNVDYIF